MIWVLPLGALALAWRLHALAAAVAAAAILTLVEFPARYFDLVTREPFALALVAVRDARAARPCSCSPCARYGRSGSEQLVDAPSPARRRRASTSTALSHGSSSEVSKRTWVSLMKRSSACSRLTPITPPRGPVMPTSVT